MSFPNVTLGRREAFATEGMELLPKSIDGGQLVVKLGVVPNHHLGISPTARLPSLLAQLEKSFPAGENLWSVGISAFPVSGKPQHLSNDRIRL